MIAGPETNEIITLNLPSDGGFNFAILVKICLCFRCPFSSFSTFLPSVKHKKILSLIFSLFFTYPIMLFPVTSILEKKLEVRMEKYKIQSVYLQIAQGSTAAKFMRLIIVLLTGLIVLKVPVIIITM